jgi:hypothetical protein
MRNVIELWKRFVSFLVVIELDGKSVFKRDLRSRRGAFASEMREDKDDKKLLKISLN